MEFISTTATAAEKLKRLAKTLRKTTDTSLAVALDAVAKQHGYEHWKHVTVCVEQTANVSRSKPLPDSLKDLLDRAAMRKPASAESQKAFAQGFVFAMDVKEAEELSLTSEYAECDDGWYLAAKDLWRGLVHYRDDETGTTLFETQSPEDLASTALDDLQNYRLFRYFGAVAPTTLEEAYKQTSQLSFFPPTHIWLGGKFIDVGEVPEIRVDGQVVFSTTPGFTVLPSNDKRTRFEKFGHLLNAEERALFDRMPAQEQDSLLLQLEKQTPVGQTRYQPVHSSVTSNWRDAKKI
nr:hypothetical protein [uncultured Albidiferax sp.]